VRCGGAGRERRGSGLYRRETQTERAGPAARRKGGRLVDLGGKKGACGGEHAATREISLSLLISSPGLLLKPKVQGLIGGD
jgi:hypothetical protein